MSFTKFYPVTFSTNRGHKLQTFPARVISEEPVTYVEAGAAASSAYHHLINPASPAARPSISSLAPRRPHQASRRHRCQQQTPPSILLSDSPMAPWGGLVLPESSFTYTPAPPPPHVPPPPSPPCQDGPSESEEETSLSSLSPPVAHLLSAGMIDGSEGHNNINQIQIIPLDSFASYYNIRNEDGTSVDPGSSGVYAV